MPGDDTNALTEAVSHAPLTPLSFLERSAEVWAARSAVSDGERAWTYAEHAVRIRRAAAALRGKLGIADGDRVAALLPNVAAMLELHYAVPGAGAVLVPMNTRLTGADYAYILDHSGARAVFASTSLAAPLEDALTKLAGKGPRVVWVDPAGGDACDYETLLGGSEPAELRLPQDERALLSINYTSGTTGRPKGVMTTHRGAYLHSLGVIAEAGLEPRSAYLWTLPMFHCNGWAYTWAVTAMGGRHLCLPAVEPDAIWERLLHEGVTHICAAPTVVTMLLGSERAAPVSGAGPAVRGGSTAVAHAARASRRARDRGHSPVRADRDLRADRRLCVESRLGPAAGGRAGTAAGQARSGDRREPAATGGRRGDA